MRLSPIEINCFQPLRTPPASLSEVLPVSQNLCGSCHS